MNTKVETGYWTLQPTAYGLLVNIMRGMKSVRSRAYRILLHARDHVRDSTEHRTMCMSNPRGEFCTCGAIHPKDQS